MNGVGIAGGPQKFALLAGRLRFDAAVDRKAAAWGEQLVAATPDGIDVDFENVDGEIMDAIFARLNLRARVVLCGLISAYNQPELPPGPRNLVTLLGQRALLQGSLCSTTSTASARRSQSCPAGSPQAGSTRSTRLRAAWSLGRSRVAKVRGGP